MWDYRTGDDPTVRRLFRTTREKLWKVLFKAQKDWPGEEEDQGLNAAKPPSKVCYDLDRSALFFHRSPKDCPITSAGMAEKSQGLQESGSTARGSSVPAAVGDAHRGALQGAKEESK